MRRLRALAAGLLMMQLCAGLGACARYDYTGSLGVRPMVGPLTETGRALAGLPPAPAAPLNVAVYDFQDLTGQNKSSFHVGFPEFSRAITQGASTILVDALKTAGQGCWFNVVERGYLDSLLRERKLIQDTYAFLKRDPKSLIEPLKFAEYIVTGGVVSYDSPTQIAGARALFAGYGAALNQSKDLVTVNLRLVRVRDGLVITSINASRPILNITGEASVTRVVSRRVLDAQASVKAQEAVQTAVREAIEAGVYELVREGDARGIWLRKLVPPPTKASDKKSDAHDGARPAEARAGQDDRTAVAAKPPAVTSPAAPSAVTAEAAPAGRALPKASPPDAAKPTAANPTKPTAANPAKPTAANPAKPTAANPAKPTAANDAGDAASPSAAPTAALATVPADSAQASAEPAFLTAELRGTLDGSPDSDRRPVPAFVQFASLQ